MHLQGAGQVAMHLQQSPPSAACLFAGTTLASVGGVPSSLSNLVTITTLSVDSTINQSCTGDPYRVMCLNASWPAQYMQDAEQLMALKVAAADANTQQQLDSWLINVPPCTKSSDVGSCIDCNSSIPAVQCGTQRPSDGAWHCNWRFIECRDRRVTKIISAK